MPTPYYKDSHVTIFCGDILDVLPQIDAKPEWVCITDPPYNIGTPQLITDVRGEEDALVGKDFGEFDREALRPRDWLPAMPNTVVSFYGAKKMHHLLNDAESLGFRIVQDFHWCKTNPPCPMRRIGFSWGVESGYVFKRGDSKHRPNVESGISPNWKAAPLCGGRERSEHPTQKPLSVMRWLVNCWCKSGDVVIDPFAGSGTTLRAAKDLGVTAIGIEQNEDYCKFAASRMRQNVLDM